MDGWLSPSHLLILLLIVLLIFGPSKLGDVGGAVGKAIRDFKRAMNDDPVKDDAAPAAQKSAPAQAATGNEPVKPS